jgi:hypothetical protein
MSLHKFFGEPEPEKEKPEAKKKQDEFSCFNFFLSIVKTKENLWEKCLEKTRQEPADYNRFFINLMLANDISGVFEALQADMYRRELTDKAHYYYLLEAVPKTRRFNKHFSKNISKQKRRFELLNLVYGWSEGEAARNLNMFSEADFEALEDFVSEGLKVDK